MGKRRATSDYEFDHIDWDRSFTDIQDNVCDMCLRDRPVRRLPDPVTQEIQDLCWPCWLGKEQDRQDQ